MTIEERLASALKHIEVQECLAHLVATGQINIGLHEGSVVYWHDESCVEAYEALDQYFS